MKKKIKELNAPQPVLNTVLALLALCALLPLILIVIVSFSSRESISANGFTFFPSSWSLEGWQYVFEYGAQVGQSYLVTIYETVVGTLLTLLFTSMFSYALSRRDWVLRGVLTIFLLITMLFSGGMVASYMINTTVYHLKNNLLILVLPGAVSAFNVIVMRTFIHSNVPDSLIESARIDGAGEFLLFFRIVMPIMVPSLAAIGFMTAVGHWNEWQTALLYITDSSKATLQLMLIRIESSIAYLRERLAYLSAVELEQLKNAPNESMRMAILLVTLGPILVAYPFFQKYFIKGITVGSVKG